MNINRREFLRLAGMMGGASLFAGCHLFPEHHPVPEYIKGAPAVDPVETLTGVENRYTVCGLCPGNCGLRCRVAAGVLVKIGGSPYHPGATAKPAPFATPLDKALLRSGAVCAIGGSGIQSLYNPFRVIRPLKRVGARGSGEWTAVTWKEALAQITGGGDLFNEGNIKGLRRLKDEGHGPAVMAGYPDWGARMFLKRFVSAFPGSSFQLAEAVSTDERATAAADAVFGSGSGPVTPDYAKARFVLSVGDAPLDSGVPLVGLARQIADARTQEPGFKWAVADPRLSTSASKADIWLPVIPGRDLDLAMGIMRALADTGSSNVTFPDEGLRSTVMKQDVAAYAKQCGVSRDKLVECAGSLIEFAPACAAFPGGGVLAGPNGLETAIAVFTLNLMVGSVPGSGGLKSPDNEFFRECEDKLFSEAADTPTTQPFQTPTEALVLWDADPVCQYPQSASYFSDREKVPLFVAIDREITETSVYADYILPDTTYLERWDICEPPPAAQGRGVGMRSPIVGLLEPGPSDYQPIFPGAKLMEDILSEIGARLKLAGFEPGVDGKPKKAWDHFRSLALPLLERMKAAGFPVAPTDEGLAEALAKGGVFSASSKSLAPKAGSATKTYQAPKLDSPTISQESADDEFSLISYSLPFHRSPRAGLNSWLLEIMPQNSVVMNPDDARKLGIRQSDRITLESLDKKITLTGKATVAPGIRPGVIAVARGFGYTQAGAKALEIDGKKKQFEPQRGAGINPGGLRRVKVRKA